MDRQQI